MEQLLYHIEVTYQISLSQYEQDFLSFPLNTQYIDALTYQLTDVQSLQKLYQSFVKKVKDTLWLTLMSNVYLLKFKHI